MEGVEGITHFGHCEGETSTTAYGDAFFSIKTRHLVRPRQQIEQQQNNKKRKEEDQLSFFDTTSKVVPPSFFCQNCVCLICRGWKENNNKIGGEKRKMMKLQRLQLMVGNQCRVQRTHTASFSCHQKPRPCERH